MEEEEEEAGWQILVGKVGEEAEGGRERERGGFAWWVGRRRRDAS